MRWLLLPGDIVARLLGLEGEHRQILRMHVNAVFWAALAITVAYLVA